MEGSVRLSGHSGAGAGRAVAECLGDPSELGVVIDELHRIMNQTGLERTLAIGRLVLERFFRGSPVLWRDRRRNKNNSVRRLADCPDCPLSRSALNQAIGVFAAVEALPCARELRSIEASHVSIVLALPAQEREGWLRRADSERWSVRRLRDEILAYRREHGERRGRPKSSTTEKAAARARRAVQALERAVEELEPDGAEPGNEQPILDLVTKLSNLQSRLVWLCRSKRRESGVSYSGVVSVADRPGLARSGT